MGDTDARKAVAALVATFHREKIPQATVEIYTKHLSDIQPPLLTATMERIVETCKFFPSIAEIRETAARLAGLLPVTAAEALAIVRAADVPQDKVDRAGNFCYTERYWHWPPDVDEATYESIKAVLAKVGDPVGRDGKPHFGWEMGFQKTYETVAGETSWEAMADLSRALPSQERKALPEPVKALTE